MLYSKWFKRSKNCQRASTRSTSKSLTSTKASRMLKLSRRLLLITFSFHVGLGDVIPITPTFKTATTWTCWTKGPSYYRSLPLLRKIDKSLMKWKRLKKIIVFSSSINRSRRRLRKISERNLLKKRWKKYRKLSKKMKKTMFLKIFWEDSWKIRSLD